MKTEKSCKGCMWCDTDRTDIESKVRCKVLHKYVLPNDVCPRYIEDCEAIRLLINDINRQGVAR